MAEYIDRSEALDAANSFIRPESIRLALEKLPVVEERKTGTWQITEAFPHNVYCSACHTKCAQAHWAIWKDGTLPKNYCPNCGARMVGHEHLN